MKAQSDIDPALTSMILGIYIHIPFCSTRCNYCHFNTQLWDESLAERYHQALIGEISAFAAFNAMQWEVDSIYFGGGTPSIVPPDHITGILKVCHNLLVVGQGCEISLEANPETLSPEKIAAYISAGVNRISIGAQSFENTELLGIRRSHSVSEVCHSVEALRAAGLGNINLDLMIGLPSQTRPSFHRSLEAAGRLGPSHISVYMLDLDAASPLKDSVAAGKCWVPDDDALAEWYTECIKILGGYNYEHYEISNFAKPGRQCRHNLKYWLRQPVMGFGVGSHSFDGKRRLANTSSLKTYLELVENDQSPIDWRELVSTRGQIEETLFLGLRLMQGLNWNDICRSYGRENLAHYEGALRQMAGHGLVEWENSLIRLTPSGVLLSNEIFQELIQ